MVEIVYCFVEMLSYIYFHFDGLHNIDSTAVAGSWRDLDLPIEDIFCHDKDAMCNFQLCGSWVWRVPLVQEDEEERAGEGGGEEYENFSEIFLS